jgi:FtsZ-binding cell division protein ZapB
LLFKTTEDSINVETRLINKIQELQIENSELKAKLASLDKETDDEKLSIKKPLDCDEGDYKGDHEGNDYRKNNLTESFSEDLNFGRI